MSNMAFKSMEVHVTRFAEMVYTFLGQKMVNQPCTFSIGQIASFTIEVSIFKMIDEFVDSIVSFLGHTKLAMKLLVFG